MLKYFLCCGKDTKQNPVERRFPNLQERQIALNNICEIYGIVEAIRFKNQRFLPSRLARKKSTKARVTLEFLQRIPFFSTG